jgi:hypothetical protein
MRHRLTSLCALILGLMLLLAPATALAQSSGATLAAGSGSGSPGDAGISVSVSISSGSGVDVAGINFDLNYSSSSLEVANVSIGSAASGAGKLMSWSTPSTGKVRVIVFGLNQDSIPNGTIASISFNVKSSASAGTTSLDISNQAATDPQGTSVPLAASDGSFTVLAPPATAVPTNTAAPTATNTSANATNEPQPTHTATALPSNTPQPKTGPSATATSQPPTRTPYPSSTHPSSSTATPTTSSNAPTATPTGTLFPQATVVGQTPTMQPGGSATSNPEEAAATDDGSAELDQAVFATSTALAIGAPSPTGTALVAADAESGQNPTSDDPGNNSLVGQLNLTSIAIVGLAVVGGASTVMLVISLKYVFFLND